MHITDNTIHFKSMKEMYDKEIKGIKSNTVRILTEKEFKDVLEESYTHIQIQEKGTSHYFTRHLTDISYLHRADNEIIVCVFSW